MISRFTSFHERVHPTILKIELSVCPSVTGHIFRRGLSGAARNEVAGQINAATRAQYLVLFKRLYKLSISHQHW